MFAATHVIKENKMSHALATTLLGALVLASPASAFMINPPQPMYEACMKRPIYDRDTCLMNLEYCVKIERGAEYAWGLGSQPSDRDVSIYRMMNGPFSRSEAIAIVDAAISARKQGQTVQEFSMPYFTECVKQFGIEAQTPAQPKSLSDCWHLPTREERRACEETLQ
jgi:hypothetical protein